MAFLLGRMYGERLLRRFSVLRSKQPAVQQLLDRYQIPLILLNRFIYGFRIAGPFVVGMSRIPFVLFSLLNMTGALIWAVVIATVGYYFGMALEVWLAGLKQIEQTVLLLILLLGVLLWLWHRLSQVAVKRLKQLLRKQ